VSGLSHQVLGADEVRQVLAKARPLLSAGYRDDGVISAALEASGLRLDAATDTALITRQLTWLLEQKTALYRPTHFREFVQVDRSVPSWVEFPVVHKVEGFADIRPLQQQGGQLPEPNVVMSEKKLRMVQFGCAYRVMDREVELAARTGVNVSAARVEANNTAVEQLLDQICATGDPYSLGLPGMVNSSDVGVVSGSGVAWSSATFTQIMSDANKVVNAVATNSNENFTADTLIMPLAQYQIFATIRSSFDNTALDLFKKQNPYIRRVGYWNRLAGQGGSGSDRMMAFDSRTSNGPRMLISLELTEEPALRIPFGTLVNQSFITGGVLIESATSCAYMDHI